MHRVPLSIVAALVVAATTLGSAAGAVAAPLRLPRDARLVAGRSPSGARLWAWTHGGQLCAAVRGGSADVMEDGEQECDDALPLVPLDHMTLGELDGPPTLGYGVTGADVASVQLTESDRPLAEAPTVAGTGPLAAWRFFLVETEQEGADELHLLDAAGRVRRAEDLRPDWVFDPRSPPPGSRRVAQGRRFGSVWALRAFPQPRLAPTPLEPVRRISATCVRLEIVRAAGPDACDAPGDEGAVTFSPGSGCGGIGVTGPLVARPPVQRIVAVLGDGTRLAAVLVPIPGDVRGLRAGAVLAPRGFAVRRLEAYDAAGRRTDAIAVALPPRAERCSLGISNMISISGESSKAGDAVPGGDSAQLAATDHDADLCLVPAGGPPSAVECSRPPLDPVDAWLTTRVVGTRRVVFGAVPPEVALVRILLDDDTLVDARPVPLPAAYAGRYGSVVRTVRIDVPAAQRAVGYELRDAAGRRLVLAPGPDMPLPRHVSTLIRASGAAPALVGGVYERDRWRALVFPCLALGPVAHGDCGVAFPGMLVVEVPCAPRQMLVYGLLRHADERLVLATASGARIRGRTRPLPAVLGRGAAALLVAPRDVAPERLLLRRRGRVAKRTRLHLPSAARQCGYSTIAWLG